MAKSTPPASMTRAKPTAKPEPRKSPTETNNGKPDRLPTYSGGSKS